MNHPHVAVTLGNLRSLLQIQQKFGEAIVLQRRVVEILQKRLPAEHPGLAYARQSLATLLFIQEEPSEAEILETQALEVFRHRPRSGNIAEARRLTSEASTCFESSNYVRAAARYAAALVVYETALGPDDASVAQSWDNLSRAIAKQGREKEAAVYMHRAERIRVAAKKAKK